MLNSLLEVHRLPTAEEAGRAAGVAAARHLRAILEGQARARVAFAAAPSQDICLRTLAGAGGIDWGRVTAFQLDDYVGLPVGAPGTFAAYLDEHLFRLVRPGVVHYLDAAAGAERYAELVGEAPLDLVLLGIGENGHLAFNDPPEALRHDPLAVRVVRLDETSRVQQVNDGCFPGLDQVPVEALTLTLPTLLDGRRIVCTVLGQRKRAAVRAALLGPVGPACPASYLREHPAASLYLDAGAAQDVAG
ncbi:glucosamine-6-phosphate deaminase [Crossiella equi]|uniref:Glucosamine-6-phosphate deaminase n=1 Tax=Crossiella equi TaxID=130796 RepID=A0ABS5ASJ4_9PSEU|nr:6-phosphogluconolactonase [Crossiella equi]MBP2479169.1 glucosamine-6-phosphate deaminase [Crossiella equi]